MTVELRPMGVACNLACTYCYQEPQREANGNRPNKYDIDVMLAEAEKTGQTFNVFGGEALLMPKRDLEKIWARGMELYGSNGIQTNGTLIDDAHIELFLKYHVSVGISIDGPDELNNLREVRGREGNDDAAIAATRKTVANIKKLHEAGVKVGLIVTLHRYNGTPEKLPKLIEFIKELGEIGVVRGNVHTLEVEPTMRGVENVLTQEENIEAFLTLAKFFSEPENEHLEWVPFKTFPKVLSGDDREANCTWKNCDPLNTQAVYGIEGDGALSNCGRTAKEGIDWYKADDNAYYRYVSLYYTPDEMGGCKGCPYWITCGGSCPGEAHNGDFRNKTIHCRTQKALHNFYEEQLLSQGITPITRSEKRHMIEKMMIERFKQKRRILVYGASEALDKGKTKMIQVPVFPGRSVE